MNERFPKTPTPAVLVKGRRAAGLTQVAAAALVYRTSARRWQEWEYGERNMDAALFEYWLILAGLAHDRASALDYWAGLDEAA